MASSDEEDLEALRNAALASLWKDHKGLQSFSATLNGFIACHKGLQRNEKNKCLREFKLSVLSHSRLNGDLLLSSPATHHRVVEEQRMLPLTNPFSVHLQAGKTSSLKDGVYLDMSVLDLTLLAAVWGVNIQAFQQELHLSSSEIAQRYHDKTMFGGKYMEYQDLGQIDPEAGNNPLYVECPPVVTETTLGEPPRTVYPIVIVTVRKKPDISLDYTAIVLQFTVLHLKDTMCSLDSHIVYQFLKTNHNQILSLQPIFVSAGDSDNSIVYSSETQCQTATSFPKLSTSYQNNIPISHDKQVSNNVSMATEANASCKGKSKNTLVTDANLNTSCDENCSCTRTDDKSFSCSSTEDANSSSLMEECNLCVVCQNAPVFYTLLLCRHACVCYSCIKLLDRCPMCRGFIDSYFRLDNAPDPELQETLADDSPRPRLPWWEALNNRLNHMLGFE